MGQAIKSRASGSGARKQASRRGGLAALSVRQPYAELILRGIKTIEYRGMATHKRERVYLYASKAPGDDARSWAMVQAKPGDLPTGCLVGTVEIVACKGAPGNYRWQLARPRRLARPLKARQRPQPVFFFPFGARSGM